MTLASILSGITSLPGADHPAVLLLVAKTTLLLIVASGITLLLQRASAGTRHLVWVATLGALLVLPALAAWTPWRVAILPAQRVATNATPLSPQANDAPALPGRTTRPSDASPEPWVLREVATAPLGAATDVSTAARSSFAAPSARMMLGLAWAGVSVLILGWLAHGALAVRRIVRNARPLTGNGWRVPLLEIADRLGLEDAPRVVVSDEARMPFACGLRTPTIVLPRDCESWSTDRRHAVLLHELAHVKRRDLVSHTLGRLACAVYWFHPLAWAAARRLRAESERACDDLALSCGARASDYAEHLLEIVASVRGDRTPVVALAMARRREFEGRMLAILDPGLRRTSPSRRQKLVVAGSVGLLAVLVGAATPVARLDGATLPGESSAAATNAMTSPAIARHDVATAAPLVAAPRVQEGSRSTMHDSTRVSTVTREAMTTAVVERQDERVVKNVSPSPRVDVGVVVGDAMRTGMHEGMKAAARVAQSTSSPAAPGTLLALLQRAPDDERPRLLAGILTSDTSASLRRIAAWGLESYAEQPVAATALATALRKDANVDVREMAAWALAGGHSSSDATTALTTALRGDASPRVRATAAWALGQLDDDGSVPALAAALADSSANVRRTAIWAIGQLQPQSAPRQLVAALRDTSAHVRMMTAWALFQIEDPTTADELEAALRVEKDHDLQLHYVHAIAALGESGVTALSKLITSTDPEMKATAVRALAGARTGGPWPMPWPMPRPQP